MSLSADFPTTRPSLLLDFVSTQTLDPRITFTRATTATYYDSNTVAKAEENLLLQSQDFNTTWNGSNLTRTNNTGDTTAPDGTSTATKVDINATTGVAKWIRQEQASLSNVVLSFFVKAGTHGIFQIYAEGSTQNFCNFNVGAGTVGSAGTNATGSIVSVGNSWYRCIVVFGSTAASRSYLAVVDSDTAVYGATTTVVSADFYVWGAQREQRSAVTAYTPTTTQAITNYVPVLLTAPAGQARFDFNPVTRIPNGLLIEEQRTNLFTYSEEFDDAGWAKTRSSITANTIVAPDGTTTADSFAGDATAGPNAHSVQQTFSAQLNTTYVLSFYVKAGNITQILVRANEATTWGGDNRALFDLSTGSVTVPTGSFNFTSITPVGNNWYRCAVAKTAGQTASSIITINLAKSGTPFTEISASELVYIWGAQLEEGAFPTSYIATTSATVTRNADLASMTGTNFSSWFNNAEGTLYADCKYGNLTAQKQIFAVGDGTSSSVLIRLNSDSDGALFQVINNGISANLNMGTVVSDAKMAGAYNVNDFAGSLNAGSVVTDTSGTVPFGVNSAFIGSRSLNDRFLNGHIRKVAYYPFRLTNAQLQALTS